MRSVITRAQHGLAGAARDADPVAVADAALLGVVRMDLEPVLVVPRRRSPCAASARRRCTGDRMRPVVSSSGYLRVVTLVGRHVLGDA